MLKELFDQGKCALGCHTADWRYVKDPTHWSMGRVPRPPERDPPPCSELVEPIKEIIFDPSYGSTVRVPHSPEEDRRVDSPSQGRSRDSLSQIRHRASDGSALG